MLPYSLTGVILLAALLSVCSPAAAQQVSYEDLEATLGEPVTTSVTGKPQRASEAPAAITIITRDQILHSPAGDIPGLLQSEAGIDVNRWTAGQSDVAVRGSVQAYNPSLLVLVDGRQVYLDHYGMTNWNLISVPLEDIQQVELVRGPASAIFGFNAASGVINIITRSGEKRRLDAVAEGGDHGYSRLTTSAAGPLGNQLSFRLSAERMREDERAFPAFHYNPGGLPGTVMSDNVAATITAKPDSRTQIDLNGGYARNRQLEYVGGATLGYPMAHTMTAGVRVAHDTGWGSIDAQLYSNWLKFDNVAVNTVPGVNVLAPATLDNDVTVAKASVLARLSPAATVRVGGEYRFNQLDGMILYSPHIRYGVWSAHAMADIHPTDRIGLTSAIRVDQLSLHQLGAPADPLLLDPTAFNRSFTTTSFNEALLIAVGRDGQLRINGGRGYQSPSLLAFGMHVVASADAVPLPIVVSGNPSLRPTAVWSGEIGYAQTILLGLKVDADLFYNRSNGIMPLPNQTSALMISPGGAMVIGSQFRNVGDVTSYGAELGLTGNFGRWTGHANYSWVQTKDGGLSASNGGLYFVNPADATPAHKVNLDATYDAGPWFATLAGHYRSATWQLAPVGPSATVAPVNLPDTFALDGKISLRLHKGVSLEMAGENLTKARGATGSPIWADRRVRAGLRVAL